MHIYMKWIPDLPIHSALVSPCYLHLLLPSVVMMMMVMVTIGLALRFGDGRFHIRRFRRLIGGFWLGLLR